MDGELGRARGRGVGHDADQRAGLEVQSRARPQSAEDRLGRDVDELLHDGIVVCGLVDALDVRVAEQLTAHLASLLVGLAHGHGRAPFRVMGRIVCHSVPCDSLTETEKELHDTTPARCGAGMKVATWQGEGRFTIDAAPEPVAGPGQVVVAVHAAGICGTDVHATQGLFPWKPPLVLGHEYTGIGREVGGGVSKSLVGRTVGCEPSYGCRNCPECAAGRVSQCPQCVRVGGFAERVALPARNVHSLPRGLDPITAAMTEPTACCLAGLETFKMPRGATVLVIGGGIMGLVTMVLAGRLGAKRLIMSDPIEERRKMARSLGAAVV